MVRPDLFFDAEADGLLVVVEEVLGWFGGVRGRDVPDEELIGVEAEEVRLGGKGEEKGRQRVVDRKGIGITKTVKKEENR